MGKLQDLLAARKQQQEKANGQIISGQVVQSKTEAVAEAPQAPEGKKPSVLDRFKKPGGAISNGGRILGTNDNKNPPGIATVEPSIKESSPQSANTATSVVEQSRPLTMAEKLKAKANAKNAVSSAPVDNVASSDISTASKGTQTVENSISIQTPALMGNSGSASQLADAQKSNDGMVDIAELKGNLKYLSDNIDNKDIVKDIVRTIASQVAHHPHLGKAMSRGEVNLMVRALRQAYHVAAMNKQSKAGEKKKQDKGVDEIAQAFKDMGVNFKF